MTAADLTPKPAEPMSRPKFAMPAGATDCHFHVFGPAGRYPYSPTRSYTPPDAALATYLALCDTLGVQRMVFVQPSAYGTDNACMLDAMAEVQGRCRGVAVIDEATGEADLQRMHDLGVRGIRVNLASNQAAGDGSGVATATAALARRIAGLGWHVQVFAPADRLPDVLAFAQHLPTELVIDHMGNVPVSQGLAHPGFRELLRALESERCWVKVSGLHRVSQAKPTYADVRPTLGAMVDAAPHRLVWGTDWPHTGPHPHGADTDAPPLEYLPIDDGAQIDLYADLIGDDATFQKILSENPARLYGFPPA